MDECLSPGFLWAYGSPALKTQLAYLTWNIQCHRTLSFDLLQSNSSDKKKDIIRGIDYAKTLIDQQTDAIFKLCPPQ